MDSSGLPGGGGDARVGATGDAPLDAVILQSAQVTQRAAGGHGARLHSVVCCPGGGGVLLRPQYCARRRAMASRRAWRESGQKVGMGGGRLTHGVERTADAEGVASRERDSYTAREQGQQRFAMPDAEGRLRCQMIWGMRHEPKPGEMW
jgi:hypothetical protein